MSELKAISRAAMLRVIKILNKETDLLKKIGEGKVSVVGKGSKSDELQENYKRIMLKLDEEKLIDETPEEAIDFWEENLDHFAEPAPPEKEKEEEEKPKKKAQGKEKPAEKKETSKKDKKEEILPDSDSRDEFGFKVGSKASLFAKSIKEKPMTMAEVKNLEWNTNKATYPATWKMLRDKGFGYKEEGGKMCIK